MLGDPVENLEEYLERQLISIKILIANAWLQLFSLFFIVPQMIS